jgi:hypothetical protein
VYDEDRERRKDSRRGWGRQNKDGPEDCMVDYVTSVHGPFLSSELIRYRTVPRKPEATSATSVSHFHHDVRKETNLCANWLDMARLA